MLLHAFVGALAGLGIAVLVPGMLDGVVAVEPHGFVGFAVGLLLLGLIPFGAGMVAGYLGGESHPRGVGVGALASVLLVVVPLAISASFELAGGSVGPTDLLLGLLAGVMLIFVAAPIGALGGRYGESVRRPKQNATVGKA